MAAAAAAGSFAAMSRLNGAILLLALALLAVTNLSQAKSPTSVPHACPPSRRVAGKCVRGTRAVRFLHYSYSTQIGTCLQRETRKQEKCGSSSSRACRCTVNGDPHYVTYDGQNMHFFGKCAYLLTKPARSDNGCRWRVDGQNQERGGSPYTYLKEVTVHVNGHAYKLGQKRRLYIDGVFRGLPYRLASKKGDVNVLYSGERIVLSSNRCGFEVTFDGNADASIRVSPRFRSRLTGLCGDCDGKKNDFRTATGKSVGGRRNKFNIIGNSYLAPGSPKNCSGPARIRCGAKARAAAKRRCGVIVGARSPFRRCATAGKVLLKKYFKDCVQDMCAASRHSNKRLQKESRCQNFAAAAEVCTAAGYGNRRWRSVTGCPLKCPSGTVYRANMSPCPKTCEGAFFGVKTCRRLPRTEGCSCKTGLMLDGNICVKKEDCRCLQCADLRSTALCARWKLKGRCKREPEVMYRYCRLTCDMCKKRKCVDLIATNICLQKKRQGKCESSSFYKEFCGLTCRWKSCKCPRSGIYIKKGKCRKPKLVQQYTKTTVFRSSVTGMCTSTTTRYFKPCGVCKTINKVVKKECNYCSGRRDMKRIVQRREGIFCNRYEKAFRGPCTCVFSNGKRKYLYKTKCKGDSTKVRVYKQKKISKNCRKCSTVVTKKFEEVKCQKPSRKYNPADRCVTKSQGATGGYTRTICRSRAVKCACSTSCSTKSFDCSCDCQSPNGQKDCEISTRCDRVNKRLIIGYRKEILAKDKFGDGKCRKLSTIVRHYKKPCDYERRSFYTCDKDKKTGKIIGCPTALNQKWPPRWYNYREGYLDEKCNCRIKVAKKVYQDKYCCCPLPSVLREPNKDYGTGACEKSADHYKMLVVKVSYSHNSKTGECAKSVKKWREVCRCSKQKTTKKCESRPRYGLVVTKEPVCVLVNANTPQASCKCRTVEKSRKIMCRKQPRYLKRKGKCNIRRGRALYRKVYVEVSYRRGCQCFTKIKTEEEPCRECSPDTEKEVIPCPKQCSRAKGRCSVNCKKYFITYRYRWDDTSKMCVRREISRIPSRCCCKPYFRRPNGPGTDRQQVIGPKCYLGGKFWITYINKQYICGKKYKKCCRKRVRKVEAVPCKVGKKVKPVKCADGRNVKYYETTRVVLRNCKCKKSVSKRPCKCSCPKARSYSKCERETNTIAQYSITWVIRRCRCHKRVETKRRREACQVTKRIEASNNFAECMAGKTRKWEFVRKFSKFYMKNCRCKEKKLPSIKCVCRCPKTQRVTKPVCYGKQGTTVWYEYRYAKRGCECKWIKRKKQRKFTCRSQKDRVKIKCHKKSGVRTRTQLNYQRLKGTCRCGWVKVDKETDRCNCDKENAKVQAVNVKNQKNPTCKHNRWYYTTSMFSVVYRNGQQFCESTETAGWRDIPCLRNEVELPSGKCNTKTRRRRYQKIWFKLRQCKCKKMTKYLYKPCGCRKDQPQTRRKIDHRCDGRGNWLITWEHYRWNEKREVCERRQRRERKPIYCNPTKKRVKKTACFKGHYQIIEHWSRPNYRKCTCNPSTKRIVLPCVCREIRRVRKCGGKTCCKNKGTGHSYRTVVYQIRKWNAKKEKCENSHTTKQRRICKCKKSKTSKPVCVKGRWFSTTTKYNMLLDGKRGSRLCSKVTKKNYRKHQCPTTVQFKTTKNRCSSRSTDTINYLTLKFFVNKKNCDCRKKVIKKRKCKCWCSGRRVFKYKRCRKNVMTVRYYQVQRLEGCRCVQRMVHDMETLTCPDGIIKTTKGNCKRRKNCTRAVFGWQNVPRKCKCQLRRLPKPVSREKCGCCKKPREVGSWFCKRGVQYRFIVTREWKPSSKKCVEKKEREAKRPRCKKVSKKELFVLKKYNRCTRMKYRRSRVLNKDSCKCDDKLTFVKMAKVCCQKRRQVKVCRKDKYWLTIVTLWTLRGDRCDKSKSYSPMMKVRCRPPPKKQDGRGGKMNCIRIRYIPYAKVINCKCHRGYKTLMDEYRSGVWCCKHRPECKQYSKPYCEKKTNMWYSFINKCKIVNRQCVQQSQEKSRGAVTCSSKKVSEKSQCNHKTMIEVTTTTYLRAKNCACHRYDVTTTSRCGCSPPLRYIKNKGGYCLRDNTWVEEVVAKSWNNKEKLCEESVISKKTRKIKCLKRPVKRVLPGPKGKGPCFKRAGFRFKMKNVELLFYSARKCKCAVVRRRVVQKVCECPEDKVIRGKCNKKTCMRRRTTVSYQAVSNDKGDMNCKPKSKVERLRCCCNEKLKKIVNCDKKAGHYVTTYRSFIFQQSLLTCKLRLKYRVHPQKRCNKRFPAEKTRCKIDKRSRIGYETITRRVSFLNKRTCDCDIRKKVQQYVCSCPPCTKWRMACENNAKVKRRICYRLVKRRSSKPFCQSLVTRRSETVPCSKLKRRIPGQYARHCTRPTYQTITIKFKRLEQCKCQTVTEEKKKIRCCPPKKSRIDCHSSGKYEVKTTLVWDIDRASNNCSKRTLKRVINIPCTRFRKSYSPWGCPKSKRRCRKRPYNFIVKEWFEVRNCKCRRVRHKRRKNMCCCIKKWSKTKCDCLSGRHETKNFYQVLKSARDRPNICKVRHSIKRSPKTNCKRKYKPVAIGPCPPYKPGMKVPYQTFIIRRASRKCCGCVVKKRKVKRPCRCRVHLKWNKCRKGDTYRRVYLIEGNIKYDRNGLPKCVYSPGRYIGKDYCRCLPNKAKMVLRRHRCSGNRLIRTFEYKKMTKRCFRVAGIALCLRECITKLVDRNLPIDCKQTKVVIRGQCKKPAYQRKVCKQIAFVRGCKCRYRVQCYKKEACECPSSRRSFCDNKTNTNVVEYKTCRAVKDKCVCKKRRTNSRVVCDKPRRSRVVDCELKRGYAYYNVDRIDKRIPGDCTCTPKIVKKETFCRCEKEFKSGPACFQGHTWRTTYKTYRYVGGKKGCAEKVYVTKNRVTCPANPKLVKGKCHKKSCTRDNLIVYNELKNCQCKKKSTRVLSRCINCCLHKGFATKSYCNKQTNHRVISHYRYVTKFNGFAFKMGKVRIPTYRCERRLARRTRKPTDCPRTKVSETCNGKKGGDSVWTKTVTKYKKGNCKCIPTTKTYSGVCRCPVSFIHRRGPCRKNFRNIYWKIYPRRPNGRHRCPHKIVPKRERCSCNRKETKTKKCDQRGNWRVKVHYTVFNPRSKHCVRKSSVISVTQHECPENRFGVPAKNCSRKRTKCVKVYKDYIYSLNRKRCTCKKNVKTRKNKRCCCPKAKKVKRCVYGKFWLWTTKSYAIDESEKCVKDFQKSSVSVECPRPYKVKGDCIGNRKSTNCGYRLEHRIYFVTKNCQCIKKQKTKRTLCSNYCNLCKPRLKDRRRCNKKDGGKTRIFTSYKFKLRRSNNRAICIRYESSRRLEAVECSPSRITKSSYGKCGKKTNCKYHIYYYKMVPKSCKCVKRLLPRLTKRNLKCSCECEKPSKSRRCNRGNRYIFSVTSFSLRKNRCRKVVSVMYHNVKCPKKPSTWVNKSKCRKIKIAFIPRVRNCKCTYGTRKVKECRKRKDSCCPAPKSYKRCKNASMFYYNERYSRACNKCILQRSVKKIKVVCPAPPKPKPIRTVTKKDGTKVRVYRVYRIVRFGCKCIRKYKDRLVPVQCPLPRISVKKACPKKTPKCDRLVFGKKIIITYGLQVGGVLKTKCIVKSRKLITFPCNCRCPKRSKICYRNKFWRTRTVRYVLNGRACVSRESNKVEKVKPSCRKRKRTYMVPRRGRCPSSGFYTIRRTFNYWKDCKCKKKDVKVGHEICRCPRSDYKKICSKSGQNYIGITTSYFLCGKKLVCCKKVTRKTIPIKCPKKDRTFKCDRSNYNEIVTSVRYTKRRCNCKPITKIIVQPCITCQAPRCRVGKKTTCEKQRQWKIERWTCNLYRKPGDWRKKCISVYKVSKRSVPCKVGVKSFKTRCNPITGEQLHVQKRKKLIKCRCMTKTRTKKCDCVPCRKTKKLTTCEATKRRWLKTTISWKHDGCKCNKKVKKQHIPIPCGTKKYTPKSSRCIKRKSGVGYMKVTICRREVVNCKCRPRCYKVSKVCACRGLVTNSKCVRHNTVVTTVKRLKVDKKDNACMWQTESVTRRVAKACKKDVVKRTGCTYKSRSGGRNYRLVKTTVYRHRNCMCIAMPQRVKKETCTCDRAWKVIKKTCSGRRRGCNRVYTLRRYVGVKRRNGTIRCKEERRKETDKCCCPKTKKTSFCDKQKCGRLTITTSYKLTGRFKRRFCEKEVDKSYDYPPCIKDKNIKRVKIDRTNCRKLNFMRMSHQRQVCRNCGCTFVEYRSSKRVCRCNYSFKSCKCVKKGRKQRCVHKYDRMSANRKRCIRTTTSYEMPVACGKKPKAIRTCSIKRKDSKGYVDHYYRVRRYIRKWVVKNKRNVCKCQWKPVEDTNQLCRCQPYKKGRPNDYIEYKRYCEKGTNTIVVSYKRRVRRGDKCVEVIKKKRIAVRCGISKSWRLRPDPPCPAKKNSIRRVFERSVKENCECKVKRKYKDCKCRCPRPSLRQKCLKDNILAIATSYKLIACNCVRVVHRKYKRLSCPRNLNRVRKAKSPKCTEVRLRISFQKSSCTKCAKKVVRTVDHWCCPRLPRQMRRKVECDAKNAIKITRRFTNVLIGKRHPNRVCKMQQTVSRKKIDCSQLFRKEKVVSSCQRRDGYTDKVRRVRFFTVEFNGEGCECVWARHHRWDVCGCRPNRVVIKTCNHATCQQKILKYSYSLVSSKNGRKRCKETVSRSSRRCGCCKKGFKIGPKCDGKQTRITRYVSFKWDYKRMVCSRQTKVKRDPVECGAAKVVKRSRPNAATCTYTTRFIRNFVVKCKCKQTSKAKKCKYCCQPKKLKEKRCKSHKIVVTSISKWRPVNCKCKSSVTTTLRKVKCKRRYKVKCYAKNSRTCKQKCCKFECKVRNCKAVENFKRTCWHRVYKCCQTDSTTKLSTCNEKKRQKVFRTTWYVWRPWRCDRREKLRKEAVRCNKRLTIDEGHCNIKGRRSGYLQEILRKDVLRRELYSTGCKCREERKVRRRICSCTGYHDEEKCTGTSLITYRHSWEIKQRRNGVTYCSPVTNVITAKLTKCKKPHKRKVGGCNKGRQRVQIVTEYADNCNCRERITEYEMTCSCEKDEVDKRCQSETGTRITTTRTYVKVCKSPFSCFCKRRKITTKRKVICPKKKYNCLKGRAVTISYRRRRCECVKKRTEKIVANCKGCFDFIGDCRVYKLRGFCESRPEVAKKCRKTCGYCPETCKKPGVVEFKPERGFSIKSKKSFKGYFYLKTIRNKRQSYCMLACKRRRECRSFDYNLRTHNCVLNKVRRDDIKTRGYSWRPVQQRDRYNVHYNKVCQEKCKCKVKAVDKGKCVCRGIGIERWCSRKFSLLTYTKTRSGKCRLNEDSSYVSVDCDESCVDLGDDCRKNRRRCKRDVNFARRCDKTCRPVCKCGDKQQSRAKGICMKRADGKWSVYERSAKYRRDRCTGLCVMQVVEQRIPCTPSPCDEKEIKVVGDCIKGIKMISIYSRKRQNNGSCKVILARTVKEDCFKCCKELMTDVGRCRLRKRRGGYYRPITNSWYIKRNGNCELKMQTRWYQCSKLACPRDFTTNGKCQFGRRLTYRVYYTLDRNRRCVRHAKAYKTYCRQRVRPECTDAYIDVLSPRQCLAIKRKGLCNRNEGSSMCARTCDLCVIKKFCTKKMGPVDLVLVVDASDSVEGVTFDNYVIPYLRSVVGKMGSSVHVSIIQYGSSLKRVLRLGKTQRPQTMLRSINRMEPSGGRTATGNALSAAADEFRKFGRKSARKVSVLITDGSNNGRIDIPAAVKRLKKYADTSLVVAVGSDINDEEIKQITSDYARHEIRVSNYRQLNSVVDKLVTKICPKTPKPKPAPKQPKPKPKPKPAPKPAPKPKPIRPRYPVDLYFVVDSSVGVDKEEFLPIKEFIKTIVNSVTVSPEGTRVSVIQYYSKVTTAIDIEEFKTVKELLPAIHNIKYYGTDRTVLGDAMSYTTKLISRNERRVPKVVIVITGEPPSNGKPVKDTAPKLNFYADKVISIGINNRMPRTELLLIASTPQDVFIVDEFKGLHDKIPSIIEKTKITKPKRQPTKSGTGQDIVFIVDSSDSIGSDNWNIYIKGLLKVITEYVVISPSDTRFALIQYSKPAQLVFGFSDYKNGESIRRAINQLKPIHRSTYPSLGNAMLVAINYVKNKKRRGVPTSAILISASTSSPRVGIPVAKVLKKAHKTFDHIIPVAIRNRVDLPDLVKLAKPDSSVIVTTEDLDELIPLSKRIIYYTTVKLRRRPLICRKRSRGDIIFVVGVSKRTTTKKHFKEIKSLIKRVSSKYSISEGASRGGVFILGSSPTKAVGLNTYRSNIDFKASIDRIEIPVGRSSLLTEGMEKVVSYARRMRSRRRPVTVIYITDGSEVTKTIYSVTPKMTASIRKTLVIAVKPKRERKALLRTMVSDIHRDFIRVDRFRDLARQTTRILRSSCTRSSSVKNRKPRKKFPGVKRIVLSESKRTITKKSVQSKGPSTKPGKRRKTAPSRSRRPPSKHRTVTVKIGTDRKNKNKKRKLKRVPYKRVTDKTDSAIKEKLTVIYGTVIIRGTPHRYIKRIKIGGRWFRARVIRRGSRKGKKPKRILQIHYRSDWIPFSRRNRKLKFRNRWYHVRVRRERLYIRFNKQWKVLRNFENRLYINVKSSKIVLSRIKKAKRTKKGTGSWRKYIRIRYSKDKKANYPTKVYLGSRQVKIKVTPKVAKKSGKQSRPYRAFIKLNGQWVRFSARNKKARIGGGWFPVYYLKNRLGAHFRGRWYPLKLSKGAFRIRVAKKWRQVMVENNKMYVQYNGKVTLVRRTLVVRSIHGKFKNTSSRKRQRRKENKDSRKGNKRLQTKTRTRRSFNSRLTPRRGNWRRRIIVQRTTTTVHGRKVRVPKSVLLGGKRYPLNVTWKTNKRTGKRTRSYKTYIDINGKALRFNTRTRKVRYGGKWMRIYHRKNGLSIRFRGQWDRIKVRGNKIMVKYGKKWGTLKRARNKVLIKYRGKVIRTLNRRTRSGKKSRNNAKRSASKRKRNGKRFTTTRTYSKLAGPGKSVIRRHYVGSTLVRNGRKVKLNSSGEVLHDRNVGGGVMHSESSSSGWTVTRKRDVEPIGGGNH